MNHNTIQSGTTKSDPPHIKCQLYKKNVNNDNNNKSAHAGTKAQPQHFHYGTKWY